MFKRIAYKLFIGLFPETLMFVGSLLLGFSLKLINTETLWEQEGVVNGGVSMGDVVVNVPVQNDPLFWWGLILFLIGSGLEFIKISYHIVQEEMEKIKAEKMSGESQEVPSNLVEEAVPVMAEESITESVEQDETTE